MQMAAVIARGTGDLQVREVGGQASISVPATSRPRHGVYKIDGWTPQVPSCLLTLSPALLHAAPCTHLAAKKTEAAGPPNREREGGNPHPRPLVSLLPPTILLSHVLLWNPQ
jgi:hypothetical protein